MSGSALLCGCVDGCVAGDACATRFIDTIYGLPFSSIVIVIFRQPLFFTVRWHAFERLKLVVDMLCHCLR